MGIPYFRILKQSLELQLINLFRKKDKSVTLKITRPHKGLPVQLSCWSADWQLAVYTEEI